MSTGSDKAQPRAKAKFAPLTAGLLARKGEAVPAAAGFTAEAMAQHIPLRTGEAPGKEERRSALTDAVLVRRAAAKTAGEGGQAPGETADAQKTAEAGEAKREEGGPKKATPEAAPLAYPDPSLGLTPEGDTAHRSSRPLKEIAKGTLKRTPARPAAQEAEGVQSQPRDARLTPADRPVRKPVAPSKGSVSAGAQPTAAATPASASPASTANPGSPAGPGSPRTEETAPLRGASRSNQGSRRAAVTLRLEPQRYLRLKIAAAQLRQTSQSILTEALDRYMESLETDLPAQCPCLEKVKR